LTGETTRSRFPLPALLAALALVAFAHASVPRVPPLLDETTWFAGVGEGRGAVLALRWLDLEAALFGRSVLAHRIVPLVLEGLLLVGAAFWLGARTTRPAFPLLALAAYLAHPARFESVVRVGARAVPIGEVLIAVALVLAEFGGRRRRPELLAAAFVAAAAGASGLPTAAAFALPLLLAVAWPASATRTLAAGLVTGAALSFLEPAPAAAPATALVGGRLLLEPWRVGLIHPVPVSLGSEGWALGGVALLIGIAVAAHVTRRRIATWAAVAALVALACAPALRVPRTGLPYLGEGITPEAFLPMVALAFAALAGLATEPGPRRLVSSLPLLAALAVTCVGAAFPPARFVDPRALVEASLVVAPEQPELHVLEGEMLLHEIAVTPPGRQEALGKAALAAAERALRVRPGDAGALALRSLAHALLGRLDEARATSDRLLALHPDDWRSLVARAEIESVAGDDVAALRWLRSALQHRGDELLRARYAALLERIYESVRVDLADRRFAEARTRCTRLAEVAPEEFQAQLTVVDCDRLAGDIPAAIAGAERLLAERPHDPQVLQRLASLLETVGERARADELKRELLELRGAAAAGDGAKGR
jgi:tetratricopeptide (TPR) repeat protein